MAKTHHFIGERFHIDNYDLTRPFASFLPAVAGASGKPLWAFYASTGQAMGGFGVSSKETPLTPFDSAKLAYENIPIRGFRTFLKVDNEHYAPFFNEKIGLRSMETSFYDLSIKEEVKDVYSYEVTYFGVPKESFPGLVRRVKLTNLSKSKKTFEIVDGLPLFFPMGLSNRDYYELPSLMEAYCQVDGLSDKAPLVRFKTSTGDNAVVAVNERGNGFFGIDSNEELLNCIVDPAAVFNGDLSLLSAEGFYNTSYEELVSYPQQVENKLPSAFVSSKKVLEAGESYEFVLLYGSFNDMASFKEALGRLSYSKLLELEKVNKDLILGLIEPATCKSGIPNFDLFIKQSYLDNNLRGGFPTLLDDGKNGETYYLFGRKHGDMERDYNAFNIPARYYSSGPGNFRDINQNRRSDLFFAPFVKDYNIYLFFNLIQADGQNPLSVKPNVFVVNNKREVYDLYLDVKEGGDKLKELLSKPYEPGQLYTLLRDTCKLDEETSLKVAKKIFGASHQEISASFAEGYWVDHWTYNVDLLENYSSIYPDDEERLLFEVPYHYFHSEVYVEPRSEKYSFVEEGKVRQYGAIDLNGLRKRAQKEGLDVNKTDWLKDDKGDIIEVDLASKILNLILVKFSTLDCQQMGIEMECEKPGWNDAMNGLPGLFASGLSETIEVIRLLDYAYKHLTPFKHKKIAFLKEQGDFYNSLKASLKDFKEGKIDSFKYWDEATSAREKLRLELRHKASGVKTSFELEELLNFLVEAREVLVKGVKKAIDVGGGILPSYLIYELDEYELTDHINHLGYKTVKPKHFKLVTIPPFLEASARALKLKKEILDEKHLDLINESGLYDKELGIYKTSASIDDAPFEIGRVHAFTKGWLERECDFLHMSYKFLLGLLKAGYYDRFNKAIKSNWTLFMDPEVYGRNPTEASSFVVPTCNPDKSKHGRGFFARLSGANAEMLEMYTILFAGEKLFDVVDGELTFALHPHLSSDFFGEDGEASFRLFSKVDIKYINKSKKDLQKEDYSLTYVIDNKEYREIKGELAKKIRDGEVSNIEVIVK